MKALFQLRCEEKGIQLRFQTDSLPEWIITDPSRYKQILVNIIGNAIKFTSQGEVFVAFEMRGSQLFCTVRDTGIGVPPDDVGKLFQPFSQVDLSIRKTYGGSGLGLILSRRLAQLMGGTVELQSSLPRQGSVFVVSITIEVIKSRATPRAKIQALIEPTRSLAGKTILVVEDSIDNQILAQQIIEKEGAKVEIANHGQAAIEAAIKNVYDLILMDMQMPILDGYEATFQLRRLGYQTPIIALTAHAMKEDLTKCLSVGCDGYICKPFKRKALIATILEHCRSDAA